MKYRYKNKYRDNEVRATIASVEKNAYENTLVYSGEPERWHKTDWKPCGAVIDGVYHAA